MILKTKPFSIREYTLADVDDLARGFSHRQILRNVRGRAGKYTSRDAKSYINKKIRGYKKKTLAHKKGSESRGYVIDKGGKLIGGIGFTDFKDTAEIGYWLAKPYWGQGIMTQVIKSFLKYLRKKYHYKAFQAKVFPFNTASARVLEKCGFRFDVRIVNSVKVGNKYLDDLIFIKTF